MMVMVFSMIQLVTMTHSGPVLWVLSQAWLVLYFYLDNGSNVCGLEFNYKKKRGARTRRGKEEDKEEDKKKKGEKKEEKEEDEKKEEEKKEELEKGGQEKEEEEEKKEEKEKEKDEDKKLEEEEEEKQDKMEGLGENEDTKSLLGADKADHETFYNDQIFRQLFLGFEVESEEGRSVSHYS